MSADSWQLQHLHKLVGGTADVQAVEAVDRLHVRHDLVVQLASTRTAKFAEGRARLAAEQILAQFFRMEIANARRP
jgi:hypothetical protein